MADRLSLLITAIVLAVLGYILSATILIFLVKFRKLRFVKMTSPKLNVVLLFGAFVLYTASIVILLPADGDGWTMEARTRIAQSRIWLLALGFTFTIGSMLVKGWRVHRLFQYWRAHSASIKDVSLLAAILLMASLDLMLMLSWHFSDPITCFLMNGVSTPQTASTSMSVIDETVPQTVCSSQHYSVWMTALLLYKCLILCLCLYIGWQTRHISFPALDDSRCLVVSASTTLILSALLLLVMVLFNDYSTLIAAIMSFSVCIGTSAVIISTFSSKVGAVLKSSGKEPLMCSASKYMQSPASEHIGDELLRILAENRYLKRRLEEKDTLLAQLKRQQLPTPVNTDCDSQRTANSANYSTPSTSTSNKTRSAGSVGSATCCCPVSLSSLLLTYLDSSDTSVTAANKGLHSAFNSPIGVHTVQVMTTPDICEEICVSYDREASLQRQQSHTVAAADVCQLSVHDDISLVPSHTSSHGYINSGADQHHVITADVIDRPAEQAMVTKCLQTSVSCAANQAHAPAPVVAASTSDNFCFNMHDIGLICTIADTYDLGDDSDTFSYISNCLYNNKSSSNMPVAAAAGKRRTKASSLQRHKILAGSQQTLTKTSTLGSDQLYPDTATGAAATNTSAVKSSRKRARRQSLGTTMSNVYINDRGNPLIL